MRENKCGLSISDLHFAHWIRNNPEKDFRMKVQPQKLAERISFIMKKFGTDYLFILGDLIDNWNEDPGVVQVLKNFYKKLIEDNPNIFIGYIEGQHDMMIRDRFSSDNSYIHLVAEIFPNNVHYMHNKTLEINGTTIYFSSYCRKGPIYPKEKVNIFMSHITFIGHEIDESNFDLCVAGDIHEPYDKGKCHSCSTPYQHYPSEWKEGYISLIKFDKENSTFKRYKSDSENFEFLKFNPVIKRKVKVSEDKTEELKIDTSDLMKMINDEVIKHGVESVHQKMDLSKLPIPINFHFDLLRLIIENFRSIDYLDLDLEHLVGINYVAGSTGSGKSSIFLALIKCFIGDKNLNLKANKKTKKEPKLRLWFNYENKEYYIERKHKDLIFKINGESVKGGSRETEKRLLDELPFVKYWKYFFMKANKHYFESIDKTEMMSVLFNLKIFDKLADQSSNRIKTLNKSLRNNKDSRIENNTLIKTKNEDLIKKSEELKSIEIPDLDIEKLLLDKNKVVKFESENDIAKSKIDSNKNEIKILEEWLEREKSAKLLDALLIKAEIEKLQKKSDDAEKINKEISDKEKEISGHESAILTFKSMEVRKCPHCGKLLSVDHSKDIEDHECAIKKLKEALSGKIKINNSVVAKEISELNKNLNRKESYTEKSNKLEFYKSENEKKENEIEERKYEINSILNSYSVKSSDELINKYNSYISKKDLRDSLTKEIEEIKLKILELENSKVKLENTKTDLESELKLTEKYNKLFDVTDVDSIPSAILRKLVKCLNTDTIKFEPTKDGSDFGINAFIKIADEWISYDEASDGQKNYLDIFILIRITTFLDGVGMLIMDEPISNMDAKYVESACELIPEINAGTILISSHTKLEGYDHKINVELNNGITKVEL